MILIYSDDHEPAPLLDSPIVEQNAERRIRPVYIKMRKVRGKTGWLLRRYGHFFGSPPRSDQEGLAHHAIQVGEYVMELTREEHIVGQRLSGHQIWASTIGHKLVGYTSLSDTDIQMESLLVQYYMRRRYRGKYHIKHNNCQTFIRELLAGILTVELSDPTKSNGLSLSDTSLLDEKASLFSSSTDCSTVSTVGTTANTQSKMEATDGPVTVVVTELRCP